jgi:hypothetical protein
MYGKQMRSTVRLRAGETGGSVVLRRLNTPLILCDLHDISEMGCRCVARIRINDWSDSEKWRALLRTGELYEAEITFDPYIPFIRLPIEIRSSIALPADGYELGLAFFDLEADHREMLHKAMISIATEKIRQSKGVLKSDMPSKLQPVEHAVVLPPATRARLSAFPSKPPLRPSDTLHGERFETKVLASVPYPAINARAPRPEPAPAPERPSRSEPKLGEVLNKSGVLSRGEVANAIFSARETGERLGEYLVREGVMSPMQILQARSAQTGIPFVDFDMNKIPMDLLDYFPFSKMKQHDFVPFEIESGVVRIACSNPIPKMELDTLERICGKKIETYLCREALPRQFLEGVARRFDRYRRAHPRYKVSLPASFQCCTPEGPLLTEATFRGRTLDISEGGMQVQGPVIVGIEPESLSPGALKMMVTVGAVPQDIVGVCDTRHIRYVRNGGGATTCIYGLKLDEMTEPHRDILQGLIARVTRMHSHVDTEPIETAVPISEYE